MTAPPTPSPTPATTPSPTPATAVRTSAPTSAPSAAAAATRPIEYRGACYSSRKQFWHGTHRTAAPAETLQRIRPYFPRVGLTRLANVTGLDRVGIPVVVSVRPNAATLSVDAGKGVTLEAATVSAAMECIERYHAEAATPREIRASYERIAATCAVIPRERLPLTKHAVFSPRRPERWTFGWDLVAQREVAVPMLLVTMGRDRVRRSELVSFQVGSNGLAAGNTFAEAVCAGLLELVERDAVTCRRLALARRGRPIPRVRLETIAHPLVLELLRQLDDAAVAVSLLDCTADTAVPVYMVYIYDRTARHVGIYQGYGAHLDPGVAMARALTEAVQARAVYIAGSRDDCFRHHRTHLRQVDSDATIRMLERDHCLAEAQHESLATPTFDGDVHVILDRLRAVGVDQVIACDLTLPGFDLAVVRVIAPGLEGYMFDYYSPGPRARALLAEAL